MSPIVLDITQEGNNKGRVPIFHWASGCIHFERLNGPKRGEGSMASRHDNGGGHDDSLRVFIRWILSSLIVVQKTFQICDLLLADFPRHLDQLFGMRR